MIFDGNCKDHSAKADADWDCNIAITLEMQNALNTLFRKGENGCEQDAINLSRLFQRDWPNAFRLRAFKQRTPSDKTCFSEVDFRMIHIFVVTTGWLKVSIFERCSLKVYQISPCFHIFETPNSLTKTLGTDDSLEQECIR